MAQSGSSDPLAREVETRLTAVMPKVIAWRRDIHQHPELGNREVRTAKLVADHLRSLGIEVQTEVGVTGVVGLLRGGRAGPVVALRADMDALPVTELVDLPFKSTVRTIYNGAEVGVMHACGHDNHVAILMGVAEIFAGMRAQIPGTIKFIFQPAEEGPPAGEEGGAPLMVKEGVLQNPRPDAIFGLHVWPGPLGSLSYRSGGAMAAPDGITIVVKGRQTHGAVPWGGVDPIVVSAQIVLGLQTIVSRQVDITALPAVVTIGSIQGGNRGNIIPDSVVMVGTIRTFDEQVRKDIHDRVRRTVTSIAAASGATATIDIPSGGLLTYNDPALTERMAPTLARTAGKGGVNPTMPPVTGAEDFPAFTQEIPGLYYFLGVSPEGQDLNTVPRNHSPYFFADEAALPTGVRSMANLALDFLRSKPVP
ncbi:MAG: amidohydrolase [Gemmatimonadales bacterium]|nr:amidohydrolase [Gemmatimonadales bacterium]